MRNLSLLLFLEVTALPAVMLEGRLPGEFFREDNPPRYGAQMSFVSRRGSTVLLHAVAADGKLTIAAQLARIAAGFRIRETALQKTGIIEGNMRWLRYSFRKKQGGGYVYITRSDAYIIYTVLFNADYRVLWSELSYIDRYIQELRLLESSGN